MDNNINAHMIAQSLHTMSASQGDAALKTARTANNGERIEDAAKEMEAVFLSQMIGHMFEGIEVDGVFGGGQSENIYRGMMVQEYGKIMAEAGGIGLADTLKAEMIRIQEGAMQ